MADSTIANLPDGTTVEATDRIPVERSPYGAGQNRYITPVQLETYLAVLAFKTIAVSGQSDVVADAKGDTLTLAAGAGMSITTNAGSDTITFASSITQYTDELAQDAVGTILTDGNTVNFTYADATPSITAEVITQMSITSDGSGIKLSGDAASPGNSKYYGTNGSGTKGFYDLPGGGGGSDIGTVLFTQLGQSTVLASTTTWASPGSTNFNGTDGNRKMPLPVGGTLKNLYVRTNNAQPGDAGITITLRKNGVAQSLAVTIAAGSAAGTFSDTTNTVTVVAGDYIDLQFANSSTNTSAQFLGVSMLLV
ncbi:MAG TPA: hypothetical protein VEA41_12230 [Salinarimonas sp.]|nr:hypothetical protein [Salinarimonas sp.]